MMPDMSPTASTAARPGDLSLLLPEWQGYGVDATVADAARALACAFPAGGFVEVQTPMAEPLAMDKGVLGLGAITRQAQQTLDTITSRQPARIFTIAGTCGAELGPVAYLNARYRGDLAVVWLDAHGDLNTPETSPSGNVHGMPLAAALGLAGDGFAHEGLALPAVDPRRVVLLGVRSLDPAERALVRETGIRAITMTEIDRIGIERAVLEAIDRASGSGFVHVSIDLDALDPEVAPGVGTPVKGGLTYREAHLACEDLAESGLVGSLELVEVNPILDRENGSAAIAVELAASALGQSIL